MHNFNQFVMAQRSTWDVVYVAATMNECFAVVGRFCLILLCRLLPIDNGMMVARKKL